MSRIMQGGRANFISGVCLLSLCFLILFAHSFISPVLAGVILATGLRPFLYRPPFKKISSFRWRKRIFVAVALVLGISLFSYVLVSSARSLVLSMGGAVEDRNERAASAVERDKMHSELTAIFNDAQRLPALAADPAASASLSENVVARMKGLLERIPGMDAQDVARTWNGILVKGREVALGIFGKMVMNGPMLIVQWIVFVLSFVFIFLGFERIDAVIERADRSILPGVGGCALIFKEATQATLMGTLVAGFCQATVITIGMALAGFQSFLLLGLLAFFASFLPFIGVGAVWGSAILYCVGTGDTQAGIIILFTGVLSSLIDNLVLPTFVGTTSNVHPLILFIVILGAVDLVGVWGLFIGPVVAIFAIQMLKLWAKERHLLAETALPEKVQARVDGQSVVKQ